MAKRYYGLVFLIATSVLATQSPAAEAAREKVPRLRFRDGPVCMCNDGLSEKKIQAADKARQAKENKGASATRKEQEQDQQSTGEK